jgi:hypothetical protein
VPVSTKIAGIVVLILVVLFVLKGLAPAGVCGGGEASVGRGYAAGAFIWAT